MANILCVDDDTIVLTALKDILSENHRCMLSKSGMDALELIEKEEPDLIILDILLDDLDGFEVVDKLRERNKNIPVIYITANLDEKREQEAFEAHAADFIRKPISPVQLRARVENQLKLVEAQELLVNKEKYAIYNVMAQSAQHILNNFLNQMLLFELTAADIEEFPDEVKVIIKNVIKETANKVEQLSNIEDVSVEAIRKTVFPFEQK